MAKARKSTKKFIKNNLKKTIENRKKTKVIKQRTQSRDEKRGNNSNRNGKFNNKDKPHGDDRFDKSGENDDELMKADFVGNEEEEEDFSQSDSENGSLDLSSNDEDEDLENFDFAGEDEEEEEEEDDEEDDMSEDDEQDLEEEEETEGTNTKDKKAKLKKAIDQHKKQLEELKEKDPEFFEYLQKHDGGLLDFNETGDDLVDEDEEEENEEDNEDMSEDGEDQEEDGEEEEEEAEEDQMMEDYEEEPAEPEATPLTSEMLMSWLGLMTEKQSVRATKKLLIAFRAAAALDEEDDENKTFSYRIDSSAVFNKLVFICMKNVVPVLNHHLSFVEGESKGKKLPSSSPKWKRLQPLIKSYLKNVLRVLKQLTDATMLQFVLKECQHLVPYFACFPRIARDYLKHILHLFTEGEEQVRILAFLNVRKLAISGPASFLDKCLKGIYLAYVRNSRSNTIHTFTSVNFMANCVVEMYGLDLVSSYQHTFVYIRQLAIQLRNAITTKTKESFKPVYNWQYLNCLRVLSQILGQYCDKSKSSGEMVLEPLIYPLVQITLGVLRLLPTSRYFPLRLHCIRLLLDLSRRVGIYIPLAPYLFEIIESAEMKKKGKPTTQKPLDFQFNIKSPKAYLGTKVYQDGLLEEICGLLLEFFATYSNSIAFPEMAIPATMELKRFIKKSKNFKAMKSYQQLLDKLNQTTKFIETKRSTVDFSPKDTKSVLKFSESVSDQVTPLEKYLASIKRVQKVLESNAPKKVDTEVHVVKKAEKKGKKKVTAVSVGVEEVDERVNVNGDDIVEDFAFSSDEEAEK